MRSIGMTNVKGYTLIELAIVMIVAGLVMAGFASAYHIYAREQAVTNTNVNIARVTQAIGNFLSENGRYPCPAAADLDIENPKFGAETECTALKGYTAAGVSGVAGSAGLCTDGICVEESNRTIDANAGTGLPPNNIKPDVVRGTIPFRALNLPEEYIYDGYHNRLMYAMTARLAASATYRPDQGGISIVDGNARSVLKDPDSAHFLVFSTGPDNFAAYTKYGKQGIPCTAGSLDYENCNTTADKFATYVAAQASSGNNATHFDDVMSYASSVDTPFWKVADDNRMNIQDVADGKQIAVGKEPEPGADPTQVKLDINQKMLARDGNTPDAAKGNVDANTLCDKDGTSCFRSELLSGDTSEMRCGEAGDTGNYMTGVANGQANCTNSANFTCPEGQYFSGVNADGTIVCTAKSDLAAVNHCPALEVDGCPGHGQFTLAEGIEGDYQTILVGWSMQDTYLCRRKKGVYKWVYQYDNNTPSYCDCEPVTNEETTLDCDLYGEGIFTGTATVYTTRTCDTSNWTVDEHQVVGANSCACVGPVTQNQTGSCPDGYDGSTTESRTWNCTGPIDGEWTDWSTTSSSCTCTPDTETETLDCPSDGETGQITRQRDLTCPGDGVSPAIWSDWSVVSNTCACTVKTETRPSDCPAGTAGSAHETRNYQCPSGVWSSWSADNSGCSCSPDTVEQSFACPNGFTGYITKQMTYTCPGPTAGSWTPVSGGDHCVPVTYTWKTIGTASDQSSSAWGYEALKPCATQGARASCHTIVPGGGGLYNNFTDCECQ